MNDERLMRVRVTANLTKYILKVWTIQSANYVRTELPVRIAHRLRDLQALPYIVVTQEGVARVHKVRVSEFIALPFAYISSLLALLVGLRVYAFQSFCSVYHSSRIRHYPQITDIEENGRFCEFLKGLLHEQLSIAMKMYSHPFNLCRLTVPQSFRIYRLAYPSLPRTYLLTSWILSCVVC